jgi:hypothetical protein
MVNRRRSRWGSRRWIAILALTLGPAFLGGCVQQPVKDVRTLPLASFNLSYGNIEIQWAPDKGWFCSPASSFTIPLGKPFSLNLVAHVEQPDYPKTYHCARCTVVSGHLPPGLQIDQSDETRGSIHGTPTRLGFYPFTIKLSGVTYSHIYIGDVVITNKIVVSFQ